MQLAVAAKAARRQGRADRWRAWLNHPWHLWLDKAKFHHHVDHVESLGISVIATCHGIAIRGSMVDEAFELIRRIPGLPRWTEPGQADLEVMLGAATAEPATAGVPGPGA